MRMSATVSWLREGLLKRVSQTQGGPAVGNPRMNWKEPLYSATNGGAEVLVSPVVMVRCWAPFDAQQSPSIFVMISQSFHH